jgi:cellulose synthase/poly-beta-1,6-N-acetylglucosamine synthase-like glycosyltransferase
MLAPNESNCKRRMARRPQSVAWLRTKPGVAKHPILCYFCSRTAPTRSLRITAMTLPSMATRMQPETPPPAAAACADYVSVIVPIYNEAAHVEELLRSIQAAPVAKEIVIVDDGSTDGTREKLLALPSAENVTVVFHQKNCGKGAAVRTGLRYAHGEYVLIQDSDLEYDPQDYAALLRPLQEG